MFCDQNNDIERIHLNDVEKFNVNAKKISLLDSKFIPRLLLRGLLKGMLSKVIHMKFHSWNIRGLNQHYKLKELKTFLPDNKVCLISCLETKAKSRGAAKKKFGMDWVIETNYSRDANVYLEFEKEIIRDF